MFGEQEITAKRVGGHDETVNTISLHRHFCQDNCRRFALSDHAKSYTRVIRQEVIPLSWYGTWVKKPVYRVMGDNEISFAHFEFGMPVKSPDGNRQYRVWKYECDD